MRTERNPTRYRRADGQSEEKTGCTLCAAVIANRCGSGNGDDTLIYSVVSGIGQAIARRFAAADGRVQAPGLEAFAPGREIKTVFDSGHLRLKSRQRDVA